MNVAIKAIARLANVDLRRSINTVRHNPLFGGEIHIYEELANLKETLEHYLIAQPNLKKYPRLGYHLRRDVRVMMNHCVGLVQRMAKRRPLPHKYTEEETVEAVRELCQITVSVAMHTGRIKLADDEVIEALQPYMSWRQRLHFERTNITPLAYLRAMEPYPAADLV